MTTLTTLYYLRDQRGRIHLCDDEGAYCNANMDGAVQVDVADHERDLCSVCGDVAARLAKIARPVDEEVRRRFWEMAERGRERMIGGGL